MSPIRVYTVASLEAKLLRQRISVAAQLADTIEASAGPPCEDHRNRPSCARCAERRTALKDARTIRQTGGVL